MDHAVEIEALTVEYRLHGVALPAVDSVSLHISPGETLGLVGESGCGKSTLAYALMGVLPANARMAARSLRLGGVALQRFDPSEFKALQWNTISMVFQSAMNSLNPVLRVRHLFDDVLKANGAESKPERTRRIDEAFEFVSLEPTWKDSYPHELSGGMKQRVVIALALLLRPAVVIADEPTTALDAVVQASIMSKLRDLQGELGFALLLVSHDIGLIAENADRVAVMYAGQLVEVAARDELLIRPTHPYTIGLMSGVPPMHGGHERLASLRGHPPKLDDLPPGCRFEPRCALAEDLCRAEAPPRLRIGLEAEALCHFAESEQVASHRADRIPWLRDQSTGGTA